MATIMELIKKRYSCRTYADKPLNEKVLREFTKLVEAEQKGPFGNKPHFQLISSDMADPAKWKTLGTYGVIKNARLFLAGKIKDAANAMEDYGYCKEHLILQATELGLGTCWLGGTFSSGSFAKAINLQEGELLPTVSPVGYPASEKSLTERMMRTFAGSDHRKSWADIFFAGDLATPLTKQGAGKYEEVLENLRLAPSASNKQPWRVLRDSAGVFHFYLSRALGYNLLRGVSLQDIDMGIAMCHFELTARESNITGKWIVDGNAPKTGSLDYIVSWQENR